MDIERAKQILSVYLESEQKISSDAEKLLLLGALSSISTHVVESNISNEDACVSIDEKHEDIEAFVKVECKQCNAFSGYSREELESYLGEKVDLRNVGQCYEVYGRCTQCRSEDVLVFDENARLIFDSASIKRCVHCDAPLTEMFKAHNDSANTCVLCKETPPKEEPIKPRVPPAMKICPKCNATTETRQRNEDGEWYICCIHYQGRYASKESGACSFATSFPEQVHVDGNIYDALRQWRAAEAEKQGVKRFMIASNKQCKEIAIDKPLTKTGLLSCRWIGESFVEKYGDDVIGIVRRYQEK